MTKSRNKAKEFLFNLVFFLIFPLLPLFKLCRKIAKCCKKDQDSKKDTKKQNKSKESDDKKGPEVEILKDKSIFKDDQPPAQRGPSKEIMSGFKRRHTGTSGNEDNIVSSGTPHGSKHKMDAPGNMRSSEETAGRPSTSSRGTGSQDKVQVTTTPENMRSSEKTAREPSTSSRGTDNQDKAQVTTTPHSTNTTVDQKAVPSPPQVGNVLVSKLL